MAIGQRLRAILAAPTSPHETRGASIVRPVVFGATDGIVTNLGLIMGVAGASSEDPHAVVIAGVAGLLAGSLSMAVGEYISVRSQRELLDYQVELQERQFAETPEQERAILQAIYRAKGLSAAEASLVVDRVFANPAEALATFVREEIGLSAQTMGSPMTAALGSLVAFAGGALIPLIPFLALPSSAAFAISIGASLLALFAVGVGVSRLTHRHPLRSGLRQAALGAFAATVTYAVGLLLGSAVR